MRLASADSYETRISRFTYDSGRPAKEKIRPPGEGSDRRYDGRPLPEGKEPGHVRKGNLPGDPAPFHHVEVREAEDRHRRVDYPPVGGIRGIGPGDEPYLLQ